jgi:poly-gamma-glutamate synthesis protein (capsule biosynthesis protein)
VLDFGREGLIETLDVLSAAGLRVAGAGRRDQDALTPAVVPVARTGGRVVVVAFGTPSSGVPAAWAATADRAGVHALTRLSDDGADRITQRVRAMRRPSDVVVASIHWGSNWGYDIEDGQVRFAHRLVDGGVDIVHGHSSHHPRPIEVYRGRLILYGCGDLVDDYEGIGGHEQYRPDLRLLYLVDLDPTTGGLLDLRMAPLQARRMRLHRASTSDAEWLQAVLDRISSPRGVRVHVEPDGLIALVLPSAM